MLFVLSAGANPGRPTHARHPAFFMFIDNADRYRKEGALLDPRTHTPVSTVPDVPGGKLAQAFGGERSGEQISLPQLRSLTKRTAMLIAPMCASSKTPPTQEGLPAKALRPSPIR